MLKHAVNNLLIFLAMLILLNACGGGEETPSGLLGSTGSTTTTGTTTTGTTANVNEIALTSNPTTLDSAGTTPVTITAIATDANGNTLKDVTISFSTVCTSGQCSNANAKGQLTVTTAVTNASGIATASLATQGNADIRTITVTAKAGNIERSIPINVTTATGGGGNTDVKEITLTSSPTTLDSAGTTPVTITAIATDVDGKIVTGVTISFSAACTPPSPDDGSCNNASANGQLTVTQAVTNASGIATASLATQGNSDIRTITVTAKAGTIERSIPISVTTATTGGGNTDVKEISLTSNPATLDSAGTTPVTITAIATDVNGNTLKDVTISFSTDCKDAACFDTNGVLKNGAKGQLTVTNPVTDAFGKATASLATQGNAETRTITVTAKVGTLGSSIQIRVITTATTDVSNIRLISDSATLPSTGDTTGVIITAIVTNTNNNLVEGVTISFTSTCKKNSPTLGECDGNGANGEIQTIQVTGSSALAGVTDTSGRAQIRLTTQVNHDNRTISVSATAPTKTTGIVPIEISVIGTKISITGDTNIVVGKAAAYVISMTDSADKGVFNQSLTLSSNDGTFDNSTVTTDFNGQATVNFTANTVKTNSSIKVTATGGEEASKTINISANTNFTLDISTATKDFCESKTACTIPLNSTGQSFKIHWDDGTPGDQQGQPILLSTTRGVLDKTEVTLDNQGDGVFTLNPNADAGSALIKAQAKNKTALTDEITITFVATVPKTITVQANPAVLGVNSGTQTTEKSTIEAVVRDAAKNPVFNKQVKFSLDDISGGKLSAGVASTDEFGRATTEYIAGPLSSAADGVKVTATVVGATPTITDSVNLTVGQRGLFVSLGSGNQLTKDAGIRYKVFHTVVVTDSNGSPVNNATVSLSIFPKLYIKGSIPPGISDSCSVDGDTNGTTYICCKNEDTNQNGILDVGADPKNCNGILDPGEDTTQNGILDPGEDTNNNGILDPGEDTIKNGILDPGEDTTTGEDRNCNGKLDPTNAAITVDNSKLTTGSPNPPGHTDTPPTGYADFDVIYPVSSALWVLVDLTARTKVEGSEGSDTLTFRTACEKADVDNQLCPLNTPFGTALSCTNPN